MICKLLLWLARARRSFGNSEQHGTGKKYTGHRMVRHSIVVVSSSPLAIIELAGLPLREVIDGNIVAFAVLFKGIGRSLDVDVG